MIKNILCSSISFCYQTTLKRVSSDVGKVKDSSVRAVQLEYYGILYLFNIVLYNMCI